MVLNKITHTKTAKLIRISKWVILICSYSYVIYLLLNFDKYAELGQQLSNTTGLQKMWLLLAIALLPLNLLIESSKWKYIVSKSQTLSTKNSLQSVLLGFSTGFLTPNRTGDMLGRMTYLKPENRKQAIVYSLLNSYTLTLVLACCGLPASIVLYLKLKNISIFEDNMNLYFGAIFLGISIATIIYLTLPQILKKLKYKKLKAFSKGIEQYSKANLIHILLFSIVRYAVFCFQFYAVLQFFGIDLEFWQALVAIPANYLFVTFTPSLAISETAIRSSYAVIFIGVYSDQLISIALAGTLIWLLNYGLPMLAGSYLLAKEGECVNNEKIFSQGIIK